MGMTFPSLSLASEGSFMAKAKRDSSDNDGVACLEPMSGSPCMSSGLAGGLYLWLFRLLSLEPSSRPPPPPPPPKKELERPDMGVPGAKDTLTERGVAGRLERWDVSTSSLSPEALAVRASTSSAWSSSDCALSLALPLLPWAPPRCEVLLTDPALESRPSSILAWQTPMVMSLLGYAAPSFRDWLYIESRIILAELEKSCSCMKLEDLAAIA
mmetsp:Transcript_6976/g.13569  ORF Transcript_6976/g.13569 Transcript_6976/m.13569 type:complete len:213 (-) Transcript_6976:3151-3789(-)